MISTFLHWLWQDSWQGAILAILALSIGVLPRRIAIPARWRTLLWLVVLLRLILPLSPQSRWSIFQWPAAQAPAPAPSPAPSTITWSISQSAAPDAPIPPLAVMSRPDTPSLLPLIFALWLAGAFWLAALFAIRHLDFSRRLRRAIAATDPLTVRLLNECCIQMRLRSAPRLLITDAITAPALTGFIRPAILLPPDFARTLSPAQLRLVFLHELCHLKSRDLPLDFLWIAAQIIHWFNPLVHLARLRYAADREIARDAAVLRATGAASAEEYGGLLLRLASIASPARVGGSITIFDGKSNLRRRVNSIACFQKHSPCLSCLGLCLTLVLACTGLTTPTTSPVIGGKSSPSNAALVTELYDVRDLVYFMSEQDAARSHPLIGSAATPQTVRGVVPSFPANAPNSTLESKKLADFITSRIGGWNQPGAQVQILQGDNQLVVIQTEANQQKIVALLNEYRRALGIFVCIDTRVLFPDSSTSFSLPASLQGKISSGGKAACVLLTSNQLKTLVTAATHDHQICLTAPRVTLYQDGKASIAASRKTFYVASLALPKGARAYVPQIQEANAGIRLDVQCSVSHDQKDITVELNLALNWLVGFQIRAFIAPDGTNPGDVQVPQMAVIHLSNIVSIPDGQTILLETKAANAQPAYVLVTAQILVPGKPPVHTH